ncbi:MAG: helix-turn-helix transcriptional regulator [Acidobacteria bacterium]|nr:helix-turn-helix transcriptional regulator [Acidobacteriota bacterium]
MFRKIGLRIRAVRLEQGIKQKELARKIGISQGALTNFELGRRKISLDWLTRIARALETPISYFLGDLDPSASLGSVGPRERRLLNGFRRLSDDARLQADLLRWIERIAWHLERGAGRGRRG